MGAAVHARGVGERDLADRPAADVGCGEHFVDCGEGAGADRETGDGRPIVQPEAAGAILHRPVTDGAVDAVQDATEDKAIPRHLGAAAAGVPGGDDESSPVARSPEIGDGRRGVGAVGIHREHPCSTCLGESGREGAAVPGGLLEADRRTLAAGSINGAGVALLGDDDDLVRDRETGKDLRHRREQQIEIWTFIERGDDDGEIGHRLPPSRGRGGRHRPSPGDGAPRGRAAACRGRASSHLHG